MVDPELIGEAAIGGTEASEVLMDGFVLVFLCVLAATLIMNHTLGHKLHVSRPRLAPFHPYSLLPPLLFSIYPSPRWLRVAQHIGPVCHPPFFFS